MQNNLFALLESRFRSDSEIFLQQSEGAEFSFRWLRDRVARFAAVLQDRGVVPGDRVVVQVETSPDNIALYLACLQIGGVYVPLNGAYTSTEVAYFIGDATPAACVFRPDICASGEYLAAARSVSAVLSLGVASDGTLAAAAANAEPWTEVQVRGPDDLAAILYTSGTTGRSKGAMLTHDNLASNALCLHRLWGMREEDVLLHALPLYHTHGLFVALNVMLLNGGSLILLPRFSAAEVVRLLPRATVFMGVPTFYTRLLAEPSFTAAAARSIRLFVSGSAPLLPETFAMLEQRIGHQVLERYGMTETCMNCSNPLEGERRPGTVGLPLPGVEVRVCNSDGVALGPDEVGVLEVRGPNVFKGYWNMPQRSADDFREDGFFVTGDLATISRDGYVTLVGREKDLIISGGLNIYPKEIEDVLDRISAVEESAVIGVPHDDFGEAVVAVIVRSQGAAVTQEEIIEVSKRTLAKFKIPKRILFVDELPRNAMGKVQKNVLRERYAQCLSEPASCGASTGCPRLGRGG